MRATVHDAKKALAEAHMQRGLMSQALLHRRKAWIDANHEEGYVELPDVWLTDEPTVEEEAEVGQAPPVRASATSSTTWAPPPMSSGMVNSVASWVLWLGLIGGAFLIVVGFIGVDVPQPSYSSIPSYERVVLWWQVGAGGGTIMTAVAWFVLLRGVATLLARGEVATT